ncbi:MAG: TolC family protein [Prevotella sp.]|nr:TolC family protein [Prevotella sp.]
MKRLLSLIACTICIISPACSQVLTLDSCRAMALRNNKQLSISRAKQQMAIQTRKAARTKRLPHIDVVGGWMLSSKEISLLTDGQKDRLSNLGTNAAGKLDPSTLSNALSQMAQGGHITPGAAQGFGQIAQGLAQQLEGFGNALGQDIKDAFRTNTRSIIVGSAIVNQPIFLGGAITATNKMADIAEQMAGTSIDATEQNVLYDIDQAYWLVVSLKQKQQLAESYLNLVNKLNSDVHKMIDNGVATRADGLKVDVKANEADMAKMQVDNGLSLAKMLLCQLCGMPLDTDLSLADEDVSDVSVSTVSQQYDHEMAAANRPELRLLGDAVSLSEQNTKLIRATRLPQVALTGGYMVTNPNLFNGFDKSFNGMWTVGIMVRVPVLDWGEGAYRVRATKYATKMACYELEEAREKVELQVTQCDYKLKEANKRLLTAEKNIKRADENLRCANLGFSEGVMGVTQVMEAQTAWNQAQSQKIDAQIDVRLCEAGMKKALGIR